MGWRNKIWSFFRGWTSGDEVIPLRDADPFYQELMELYQKVIPDLEVSYKDALEAGKETFKENSAALDQADLKAQQLITWLGGGLTLLTSATIWQSNMIPKVTISCLIVSMILSLVTILLASRVRLCVDYQSSPTVKNYLDQLQHEGSNRKARYSHAITWQMAAEERRIAANIKAGWMNWANRFYMLYVASLIVAVSSLLYR